LTFLPHSDLVTYRDEVSHKKVRFISYKPKKKTKGSPDGSRGKGGLFLRAPWLFFIDFEGKAYRKAECEVGFGELLRFCNR